MKKKLLFLVIILMMLVGCNKSGKFYLDDIHYNDTKIIDISGKKLSKLEEENKNILVFVYLPGCSSCADFKKVLTEFIQDNKLSVYSLSIMDAEGTAAEKLKFAPSLLLYKDGKVIRQLDAASDSDTIYFKDKNELKKMLEEYIYLEK